MLMQYWGWILTAIGATPVAATMGFAMWMRYRSGVGGDLATKYWDTFIKLTASLAVIAGSAFSFGGYVTNRLDMQKKEESQQARLAELREAELLTSQLRYDSERHERARAMLYEARRIVAVLANHPSGDTIRQARFEELYYADLIGVENPRVARAMIEFMNELTVARTAPSRPTKLNTLSLRLSHEVDAQVVQDERAIRALSARVAALIPERG